ncbi:Na+/H+ antiporter [Nakamurella sp. YIM 132084]|uniref:Na+/H+ antiporter n=2 Tax=Nakamurella leprariae TaxID=2803911 RepID=A0A939C153_9ACTN|nr:Na+/H+ antiporter [Nakamurella leprariae]MBM9469436.1 Na+/H+ antiporter [Nakamurella leprariae]
MLLILTAMVTAVSALAERIRIPAPLLLVVVGVAGSFLPIAEDVRLTPELVLIGLLPPLLYAAAIRTSLVDLRANRRVIGLLAVGLVLFTTLVVGLITWWLLPVPLAAAIAFGAVVAPPDAVAATSIARRVGLPRRIVTVLEGESLLNDATALVALRTAIAAIAGSVSVWQVGGDFLLAAVGGAAIGLVVAYGLAWIRSRIANTTIDTAISLMAPFVAYLPAEEVHASGVIAVVITGLVLGHKAPVIQSARSRISERTNWGTIQFLLENSVFLLIGLQLRFVSEAVAESTLSTSDIVWFCVGVLLAVIISRPVWVFPVRYLLIHPKDAAGQPVPWTSTAIVSWAGMRGVVTLAAAFVLPADLPHVEVLVLGAFVVTAGTLLLQGLSLPWLARRLRVRGPDAREDTLQEVTVLRAAMEAGRIELDRIVAADDDPEIVEQLRRRAQSRINSVWERLGDSDGDEPPSAQYRRLRTAMLAAERDAVLEIRDAGTVDAEVLDRVMATLDVEESLIDKRGGRAARVGEDTLTTPRPAADECDDLRAAKSTIMPLSGHCEDCIREGTRPVHLRLCMACGNVGCCDSSVGRHATRHFHDSAHPVMRSFEPGEAWRWCYTHEVLG